MSKDVHIDLEDLSSILQKTRKGDRSVEARRQAEQKAIDDAARKKNRKRADLVQLNTRVRPEARRKFLALCARHHDARGVPEEQGVMLERMIEFCFEKTVP